MTRASNSFDLRKRLTQTQLLNDLWTVATRIVSAKDDRARTQRDALMAFMVRVTSAGLLYLSQIALARWMGGSEYGVYVSVWTWVVILGGLSDMGFNLSLIRLTAEYRERSQFALLRGVVRFSRLVAFAIGTAVMTIGIGVLWFFEPVSSSYMLPLYLALICIPLYALTFIQDGIGRGQKWMMTAMLPTFVFRPALILVFMCAAYLSDLPTTATTAAISAILATYAMSMLQVFLINRHIKREIPEETPKYQVSHWVKISLPLLCINACELLLQNVDVLIVSRYLSAEHVGIYFAAAKTMSLIMFVHYAVGSAVANRFSALNARGDKEQLHSFVRDAVNWTFWPSLLGAAVILALGQFLLSLFGTQFVSGFSVMVILVIGFLFRSAIGPADFLLNMLGEQKLCALALALTVVLNIVLNFTLVPTYGLNGAATATSLSLIFAAVLHYSIARWRLGIDMGIWSNLPISKRSA